MLTDRLNLRGGHPCWQDLAGKDMAADPLPARADIAIVGAGVMGAMLAERLTAEGRSVALLDRRRPATGSTAASTALVMWASDVPLTHLSARIGDDKAARAWRRVHAAVGGLAEKIARDDIDAGWQARPELYLAGSLLDPDALRREADARIAAGLPSQFLAAEAVAERFALPPRAALLSDGSHEVDPVELTLALLDRARRADATLTFPADAVALDGQAVVLGDGRRIEAETVIVATGYEAARWYLPEDFALGSSFAIASAPGVAPVWRERALIWEASDPYLYARTSADGRIIVGGADEDGWDATARDAMIPAKRGILEAATGGLLGRAVPADCAWAATFGRSPDGLPAIGRARNAAHVWLASGFGGNGITFAALAADLLARALAGQPDPDAALFDPYRFG